MCIEHPSCNMREGSGKKILLFSGDFACLIFFSNNIFEICNDMVLPSYMQIYFCV